MAKCQAWFMFILDLKISNVGTGEVAQWVKGLQVTIRTGNLCDHQEPS